jgi:hypothetical protein
VRTPERALSAVLALLIGAPGFAAPRAPLPSHFTAQDFASLTEQRAARAAAAFPRVTAFLESRRAEVEAAQKALSKHRMPASRCLALSALEAWLARAPQEAVDQLAAYLTVPPHDLLRDAALLLTALDELKAHAQAGEVAHATADDHAQLEALVNDPSLPASQRAEMKAQLADLMKNEASLGSTGYAVPQSALAVAARYRAVIESWPKWSWPKRR